MDVFDGEYSLQKKIDVEGAYLLNKYRPIFEDIKREGVAFAKPSCPFKSTQAYHLGKQFETYKQFEPYLKNENASAADLGMLPKTAIDIIATQYAISIGPLFASMQTIGERQGLVYFKKLVASGMINAYPYTLDDDGNSNGLGSGFGPQSRGGLGRGDQVIDARRGWVGNAMDYATEQVSNEDISGGISGSSLDTQIRMFPIRRNNPVRITATDGYETHEGTFLNTDGSNERSAPLMTSTGWATGTITFATGRVKLDFKGGFAPNNVSINYMQDFETAADIPTFDSTLTSIQVQAETFAIKQNISTLKAFEYARRFGRDADSEALMDLAGLMADIESRRIVQGYVGMANWVESEPIYANQPIEFDMITPPDQSEYEYRQGFRYLLTRLDSRINLNSGRGAANRYMVGHTMGEYISALPKFESAPANLAVGSHLLGYIDGKPVVRTRDITGLRVPSGVKGYYGNSPVIVPENALIASYLNPQSPWDAPMVEATFMPLFVTQVSRTAYNPLQNDRAICTSKAFCPVVPQYVKAAAVYNSGEMP